MGPLFKSINLSATIEPAYPVRAGISNSDVLKCYLALLTLGKNDFEAVEGFRSQRFAHPALLGLYAVTSSATLRQHFESIGTNWCALADLINRAVLGLHINRAPIDFGSMSFGHLPLDINTFVMDHSDTAKEGVCWTYAGVDGYCPIALSCDHATHEQFHAEFKTVMDLNHLPSATFNTNHPVCSLAAVAMHPLPARYGVLAQRRLSERDSPLRKPAYGARLAIIKANQPADCVKRRHQRVLVWADGSQRSNRRSRSIREGVHEREKSTHHHLLAPESTEDSCF